MGWGQVPVFPTSQAPKNTDRSSGCRSPQGSQSVGAERPLLSEGKGCYIKAVFAGSFPVICSPQIRLGTDGSLYQAAVPSATEQAEQAEQGEASLPKDVGIWVERQEKPRRPSSMQLNWPLLRHKILHAF